MKLKFLIIVLTGLIVCTKNKAPYTPPTPKGQTNGAVGSSYSFSSRTFDPDGDNIAYQFDWGDGSLSEWSQFVLSGDSIAMSKSWTTAGTYKVKVRAKDIGAISNWSNPLTISIAKPTPGTLKWRFKVGRDITSPAIGSDGTIYLGSYAIDPNGTLKWHYPIGGYVLTTPAIGDDGTIYFGASDSYFYALNSNGTLKWRYYTDDISWGPVSPAIGSDVIYIAVLDTLIPGLFLCALNIDGTLRWRYQVNQNTPTSPAIAPDGTIYFAGYSFYALNPDGTLKWKIEHIPAYSSPAIGSDGTIYIGASLYTGEYKYYLYALNPDGGLKWRYLVVANPTSTGITSSPAIGDDGTIYFGGKETEGPYYGCLYAITPYGSLKWSYQTKNQICSSPAIASDGTIYFGSDYNWSAYLYAVNPNGTLKWQYSPKDEDYTTIETSPTIGSDGTIYFAGNDGYLYALYGDPTSLASTPWPKFRHDLRNTGAAR